MNQIKTYNYNTCQFLFRIRIDYNNGRTLEGTFAHVSRIIHSWIVEKFSGIDIPEKPHSYSTNRAGITIDILYDWDKRYYTMRTTHTDREVAGKMWITQASLYVDDNGLWLGIKNHFSIHTPVDTDYSIYSAPSFVNRIASNVYLMDSNNVVGSVQTVGSEQSVEELFDLVTSKERTLPVIIISEASLAGYKYFYVIDEPGHYFLDGGKLCSELNYLAHVFYLPLLYQTKWNELIGSTWEVYNGAVRTYYPNFLLDDEYYHHPIMVPQKIMNMDYVNDMGREYIGGHAFRHLLVHIIKDRNMTNGVDWTDNNCKFIYERARDERLEKQKNQWDNIEFYRELEKENDQLIDENKNYKIQEGILKKRIDELSSEIYRLGAINAGNQELLFEKNNGLTEATYPKSYDTFSEWVDEYFGGRIYLHPRARHMIKEADYVNIEDLCDAVRCLADYYYYLHMGRRTREEYKNELERLHIDDLPAVSEGSLGMHDEQYFVVYNGRKRKLERHLVKGNSWETRYCFRIYFFWDDETYQVIIGSMPRHLDTTQS